MKFTFGDIVVVDEENIGVIVKSWTNSSSREENRYEIYVRMYNAIKKYPENKIERYIVRHKYLSDHEKKYQFNSINNL